MGWIKEGWTKLSDKRDTITVLRTRNHMALDMLRRGKAGDQEMHELVTSMNMAEALSQLDIGDEFGPEVLAGQQALVSVLTRAKTLHKMVLTAKELAALNLAMSVHDAQLDEATVNDIELAMDWINAQIKNKQAVFL